nr:MAG TPA: hypothetical protein [Caudoviricetes sp.]
MVYQHGFSSFQKHFLILLFIRNSKSYEKEVY